MKVNSIRTKKVSKREKITKFLVQFGAFPVPVSFHAFNCFLGKDQQKRGDLTDVPVFIILSNNLRKGNHYGRSCFHRLYCRPAGPPGLLGLFLVCRDGPDQRQQDPPQKHGPQRGGTGQAVPETVGRLRFRPVDDSRGQQYRQHRRRLHRHGRLHPAPGLQGRHRGHYRHDGRYFDFRGNFPQEFRQGVPRKGAPVLLPPPAPVDAALHAGQFLLQPAQETAEPPHCRQKGHPGHDGGRIEGHGGRSGIGRLHQPRRKRPHQGRHRIQRRPCQGNPDPPRRYGRLQHYGQQRRNLPSFFLEQLLPPARLRPGGKQPHRPSPFERLFQRLHEGPQIQAEKDSQVHRLCPSLDEGFRRPEKHAAQQGPDGRRHRQLWQRGGHRHHRGHYRGTGRRNLGRARHGRIGLPQTRPGQVPRLVRFGIP